MSRAADQPDPDASLTPAMRQYQQFKQQYPDYVLFFRMGDFYEMFWEDARLAHRVLGVTLTSRSRGGPDAENAIPMAGVPFHSVEGYLRRMIAAGYRVAICEQTEVAGQSKGVIRREVTRLMTPGTLTDDPLLDAATDNYLAAFAQQLTRRDGHQSAVAWVELSTGVVRVFTSTEQRVIDQIRRIAPAETLVPENAAGLPHVIASKLQGVAGAITSRPGWQFTPHHAAEMLNRQYGVSSGGGFGIDQPDDPAALALGAILSYLEETQRSALPHLRPPSRYLPDQHLHIDPASFASLEIDRTVRSQSTSGSLLGAINRTRTAMGARLLRQWVRHPLTDVEHIVARQSVVAAFFDNPDALRAIAAEVAKVCDIERIASRVVFNRATPRDLLALGRAMQTVPTLAPRLDALPDGASVAADLQPHLPLASELGQLLTAAIKPDTPAHLREGNVIESGFDAELDRLRSFSTDSQQWLASYQARLAAESGIASLKVGYNKVFGYYIEVTDTHREKVPDAWTRKQTVKNAERYITSELKAFETEALNARERSITLEQQLFESVRQKLLPHVTTLLELASIIARLDVLGGLAMLALERRYCRPQITDRRELKITEGRHPVLEQQLDRNFVANDLTLDETDALLLITGPNMAGKSTYIRQVALITLLAQIGSFVPAKSATIGVVDRLFARIGASDEIHSGQSTFMVEMTEAANILNNATDRSLVILDEIGRGTSTLDGLSLAWAISEHLACELRCRTLFATHYHELTDLAERFSTVRNANVAVREWEDQVVFLHRIVEGGTDRSYGIHVARLAGVPRPVLERARQLLGELAVQHVSKPKLSRSKKSDRTPDPDQLPLFVDPAVELLQTLASTDPDRMTAADALELLRQWKARFARH